MNLSFVRKHRFALAVGAAAVAMIVVAGLSDAVVASNMGFKMNRQILVGRNLVSLPYKTPIATAFDLCNAFGKAGSTTTVLTQFFPGNGASQSFPCNASPGSAFATHSGHGVLVVESGSSATGIIVGSHIPGQGVQILGPSNFLYAYPYHTTNQKASDICAEFGLDATSAVQLTRFSGLVSSAYPCSASPASAFSLVLGEAVLIKDQPIATAVVVPSHF